MGGPGGEMPPSGGTVGPGGMHCEETRLKAGKSQAAALWFWGHTSHTGGALTKPLHLEQCRGVVEAELAGL